MTTKIAFNQINGMVVNVKDFGAVGDGVADDSVAVQAASDTGAAEVYFPNGTYLMEGVTFSSNTRLFGPGTIKAATAIHPEGNNPYTKNAILVSAASNIILDGLHLDGGIVGDITYIDIVSDATDLVSMLDIQNCTNLTLTGVTFNNIATLATSESGAPRNEKAKKCIAYILGCTQVLVEKCVIGDNCSVEGIGILDSSEVTVDRNYCKQTRASRRISSPVFITGADTEHVKVTDNILIGHGGSGLNLWGKSDFKVTGNTIVGRGIDFSNEGGYTVTESPRDINIIGNTIDFTGTSGYVSSSVGYGVFVAGAVSYNVKNVVARDNTITSAITSMLFDRCDDVTAEGNRVINSNGTSGGQGLGIASTDSLNVKILGNYVNSDTTTEFGGGVCCIYTEGSTDVLIKDNILDEAVTYLLYLNRDNTRVTVEGNIFKYANTSPTRNIFGLATACDNLILKNNQFPLLAGNVDYNSNFSSVDYLTFEDDQVIEIADDTAYVFSPPVSYYFVEISTSANGNAGAMVHNDAALVSIYAGSAVNVTTGALTGTDGTDAKLNVSAAGNNLYIENRLGASAFIRVKIRG